jgi:quercetin dioxygenase-like cupin family protein
MGKLSIRKFSAADETRPFTDKGHAEILHFADQAVGRAVFEPGWQWSKHVKPIAGTASCQAAHVCYVLSGRMRIVMDDGESSEMGPGDVAVIPPGHDAWTLGDQACVALDFAGMENYAKTAARPPAETQKEAPTARH